MKTSELEKLLTQMTLPEKIGQLVQLTPDFFAEQGEVTGPSNYWHFTEEEKYNIGSVLGTRDKKQVRHIQEAYLQKSRLKIPLMFMADVIHGYETIFPIPLALAGSFDPQVIEKVASISASEATEDGIQVTFSPMVDHVEDARWGRVMESNGEDPTLSTALAKAYIRGYQGPDLAQDPTKIAACLKHFVGYGAVKSGRDYNGVDMSELALHQNYLPAFKAAIAEGAELVMTSFNSFNGVPASANKYLMQDILRDELAFEGILISDYSAIAELIAHRVAEDKKVAAELALTASVDIDMVSDCYQHYLSAADEEKIDQAVRRILRLKNKLVLFEDPYRGLNNADNAKTLTFSSEYRAEARKIAQKTITLLKNEGSILPLPRSKSVALVGTKADSTDLLGGWAYKGDWEKASTVKQSLEEKNLHVETVGSASQSVVTLEEQALMVEAAKNNEVVIIAVGETSRTIGENKSKTKPELDATQIRLIEAVHAVNDNIVLVLFNGRPLVLTEVLPLVKGVVEAWFPGTEGGRALADILVGDANPQGKLPMSFPETVGQLPLTYQEYSTGRPNTPVNREAPYVTKYIDASNQPLFAFGYGLSYSTFVLSDYSQSSTEFKADEEITIEVSVKNTSAVAGIETVQLYVQDKVAEVVRPTRELKKWQHIFLAAGQEQRLTFTLTEADLRYVHTNLIAASDPGEFLYGIGADSTVELTGSFRYLGE